MIDLNAMNGCGQKALTASRKPRSCWLRALTTRNRRHHEARARQRVRGPVPGKTTDSCATRPSIPLFRIKDREVLQCFPQPYIVDWPESISIERIEQVRAMPN